MGDEITVETFGVEVEDKFEQGTRDEGGGEVGGQVVVEEELSAHEVEGEVVGCPAEEEEAGGVVEAGACSCNGFSLCSLGIGLGVQHTLIETVYTTSL